MSTYTVLFLLGPSRKKRDVEKKDLSNGAPSVDHWAKIKYGLNSLAGYYASDSIISEYPPHRYRVTQSADNMKPFCNKMRGGCKVKQNHANLEDN